MSELSRLSIREVRELTGTPIIALQLKFLRDNGIAHYIDTNHSGRPAVLRSAVEPKAAQAQPAKWTPNKSKAA